MCSGVCRRVVQRATRAEAPVPGEAMEKKTTIKNRHTHTHKTTTSQHNGLATQLVVAAPTLINTGADTHTHGNKATQDNKL